MKIAILGGGNMGAAFARSLLEKKICAHSELLIVESVEARRTELSQSLGCRIEAAVTPSVGDFQIVFLAVKPFDMQTLCAALRPHLQAQQMVVSILAGITLASISEALSGHKIVVRCMPNLPVQLGLGMSVYFASPYVLPATLQQVKEIFDAAGASLLVPQERLLDAATAVSGSGPAYVFYFIEHMLQAAQELGFSGEDAELLVDQTMAGALALWTASGETPAVLRERVTSKGGTTAAALSVFESRKLGQALVDGIKRADERCRELQAASSGKVGKA